MKKLAEWHWSNKSQTPHRRTCGHDNFVTCPASDLSSSDSRVSVTWQHLACKGEYKGATWALYGHSVLSVYLWIIQIFCESRMWEPGWLNCCQCWETVQDSRVWVVLFTESLTRFFENLWKSNVQIADIMIKNSQFVSILIDHRLCVK